MSKKEIPGLSALKGRSRSHPKQTESRDEPADLIKGSVRCKCPKCEKNYNVHMRWVGRGTPRVYCRSCRPLVAGLCESSYPIGGRRVTRSKRKGGQQVLD